MNFKKVFCGDQFSALILCKRRREPGRRQSVCGLVYGILQFVLGPYVLTLPQVLFDYVFAFMVMGLSGLFCRMKNGLIPAYIVAVIGRWIMATIAGLI